ncbi:hypothetical protein WMF04_40465 [Sorangium sp. So ce260]|uniref:hypothetical protein n=1 Tax=Sorangium sp. So ce260 TaxID=3133291 RepID=UPI003F645EB9
MGQHAFRRRPYVVAGGGGAWAYLRTGRFTDVEITSNKLLTTRDAAVGWTNGQGGPLDNIGDSSFAGGLVGPIIAFEDLFSEL